MGRRSWRRHLGSGLPGTHTGEGLTEQTATCASDPHPRPPWTPRSSCPALCPPSLKQALFATCRHRPDFSPNVFIQPAPSTPYLQAPLTCLVLSAASYRGTWRGVLGEEWGNPAPLSQGDRPGFRLMTQGHTTESGPASVSSDSGW